VLDLSRVVTEMASVLHPLLPADIALETRAEGVALVRADRAQLEQVIINLAFNARDAMARGGRLVIGAEAKELDQDFITAHSDIPMRPGCYGVLTVCDNGTGMSPEISASIFEPFFTTKGVGQGTGLGLATVYGIVKQSGGFIWVDSASGKGTEFSVCLPLAVDHAAGRPALEPGMAVGMGPLEPGRGVVLIVEDDEAVRTVMLRTLREAGYSVLEARNGSRAQEALSDPALNVDLVVTDLVMPEMGGTDLRSALRTTRPETPVLLISAYPFEDLRRRGLLEAGDPFLQKPYTRDALIRIVQSLTATAGAPVK
jgi:CheY-like chemotaxis protein